MNKLMLFSTLVEVSILVPVIIIFLKRKYIHSELRILIYYVAITLIRNFFGVTSDLLFYTGGNNFNTLFFYNWHSVLGFYIIVFLYFRLLSNQYWKLFIIIATLIFTVLTVMEIPSGSITDVRTALFNKYTYTTSSLLILIIVLGYFYQLLQDLKVENITQFPYFWVSVGLLFYFGGSLFVYLFLLKVQIGTAQITWTINSALSFLLHITMCLAFWYSSSLSKSYKNG
ncbi:hypothetical protein [Emticicia sp. 17c]|uniref:hypothetical protein n=1 Tax=Emticicia sp. 17c TaxID=3127704 RepID=UPI00301DF43A